MKTIYIKPVIEIVRHEGEVMQAATNKTLPDPNEGNSYGGKELDFLGEAEPIGGHHFNNIWED